MRWIVLLVAIAACDGAEAESATTCERLWRIPIAVNRTVDLLFVIDDGPSMANERETVRANSARFATVLANLQGGFPDLHVGVITAGGDGALRADCPGMSAAWLAIDQRPDGQIIQNFGSSLSDALVCLLDVPPARTAIPKPFVAVRRALDGRNVGFLRKDAYLMVVFVTDRDDCSSTDPMLDAFGCAQESIACSDPPFDAMPGVRTGCHARRDSTRVEDWGITSDFLKSLKTDPSRVLISVIAGNPEPIEVVDGPALAPTCVSAAGDAGPAVRLLALARAFPDRNTFSSICQPDVSDALTQLAQSYRLVSNPCVPGPVSDPLECVVVDVVNRGSPDERQTVVAPCAANGPLPCWSVTEDPMNCASTETQLRLDIIRDAWPSPGTLVEVRCAVECP